MTQSPLFPDIVPEPDATVWDVLGPGFNRVDTVIGKLNALALAQALAEEINAEYYIMRAPHADDTEEGEYEKFSAAECVRPFGLPW